MKILLHCQNPVYKEFEFTYNKEVKVRVVFYKIYTRRFPYYV